jgi:hypothetical protein
MVGWISVYHFMASVQVASSTNTGIREIIVRSSHDV